MKRNLIIGFIYLIGVVACVAALIYAESSAIIGFLLGIAYTGFFIFAAYSKKLAGSEDATPKEGQKVTVTMSS